MPNPTNNTIPITVDRREAVKYHCCNANTPKRMNLSLIYKRQQPASNRHILSSKCMHTLLGQGVKNRRTSILIVEPSANSTIIKVHSSPFSSIIEHSFNTTGRTTQMERVIEFFIKKNRKLEGKKGRFLIYFISFY